MLKRGQHSGVTSSTSSSMHNDRQSWHGNLSVSTRVHAVQVGRQRDPRCPFMVYYCRCTTPKPYPVADALSLYQVLFRSDYMVDIDPSPLQTMDTRQLRQQPRHAPDEIPSLQLLVSPNSLSVRSPCIRVMQLPIEILEGVIDQTCDSPATLRDLSLTCSEFLPRARYHIFTSIVIRTMEQMLSSRDFLDARPWLLPLVYKVTLDLSTSLNRSTDSEDRAKQKPHLLHVVPMYLFAHFPNLRVWRIHGEMGYPRENWVTFHRSTLRYYNICSSHIHHLELCNIQFKRMSDFARLVSAFTSIHTLTCTYIQLPTADSSQNTLRTQSLHISTLKVSLSLICEHLRD